MRHQPPRRPADGGGEEEQAGPEGGKRGTGEFIERAAPSAGEQKGRCQTERQPPGGSGGCPGGGEGQGQRQADRRQLRIEPSEGDRCPGQP